MTFGTGSGELADGMAEGALEVQLDDGCYMTVMPASQEKTERDQADVAARRSWRGIQAPKYLGTNPVSTDECHASC